MQLKKELKRVKIATPVVRVSDVSHPFIYFTKHHNEFPRKRFRGYYL